MIWPFPKKVTVEELRDREDARRQRDKAAADRTNEMSKALERALRELAPRTTSDD